LADRLAVGAGFHTSAFFIGDRMIETVLSERHKTHGMYSENAAIAQKVKRLFRERSSWNAMAYTQAQAFEYIVDKLSRIACGNPAEIDHWRDIIGYASLVLRELEDHQNYER
jgi:hypothetical protein